MINQQEKIEDLVAECRLLGPRAIGDLMEELDGLVRYKARKMVSLHPINLRHLEEDIYSEGVVALLIAVNRLVDTLPTDKENSLGYLSVSISRGMGIFVDTQIKAFSQPLDENRVPDSVHQDPTAMTELWDSLLSICNSSVEEGILFLRASGHTDGEISQVLKLPRSTVQQLRKELNDKFDQN